MDLRSCNHLHFIQAVEGGLVTKILNTTRGRPALKFKKLQEIYEAVDAKNHDLLLTLRPKNEFESFSFDSDRIEVKSPHLHMVDRRTIKREPETSDLFCNGTDKRINSDSGDSGFGNMTLKQIKERCKAKKRKRSNYVELSKETSETSFNLEQVQTEDEDFDLEEPLSSLKSKLSKNTKAKKKRVKNHVSTSPQIAISIVKSEQVPSDEVLPQSGGDLWPAININIDVPEPDYSNCQNIGSDPSLLCDEPDSSSGMVSSELCDMANEYVLETQVSILLTKEPKYCVTNEVCYEYMEPADPKSFQNVRSPCEDSVKPDNTETTSHESSDLPVPESEIEIHPVSNAEIHPVPNDTYTESISSTTDHSSYISGISQSSPCTNEILHNGNDIKVQVPHMTIHKSPQGLELRGGGDAYVFEDSITADLPSNPEVSVVASSTTDRSLSPDRCLGSIEDDSPTTGENQPQKSACANAEINVSGGIHPFDATDELRTTVGFGSCHGSKLQHPPERLFATRKAISPTSRERLLKAMDSFELPDDEYYKCRREYFGKNKFGRVEGPDWIRGAECNINPQKMTRKPKNYKRGFHPSGVPKVPYLSCAAPRFSTGCTSIQSCSQSAIEFSQQQMKDFECLATKLTKELKTMKDIVEERLIPQACPASSLKYNVDKARMAINSATRVEEGTRKWISMMARDCNRFCKIMRMTEKGSGSSGNVVQKETKKSTFADEAGGISVDQFQGLIETGSASSGNAVHKERRKISFADEAGGKLCHVRLFDDDTASLLESNTEKQVLMVD